MKENPCPEGKHSEFKKMEEENYFFPAGKKIHGWLSKCELLLR